MTTLSTLLASVATAIANSATIETFCQANFSKSISVYVHLDPKNPPSISKAPWVGLTIQGYSRPAENAGRIVTFDLETAVYCEKSTETTSGKITTLGGFATLESLSDLVFGVIETAVTHASTQLEMDYVSEQGTSLTTAEFPGWIAARTWTIGKHI